MADILSLVQRNQIHNELSVEAIIRQRSLDGGLSPDLCQHHFSLTSLSQLSGADVGISNRH